MATEKPTHTADKRKDTSRRPWHFRGGLFYSFLAEEEPEADAPSVGNGFITVDLEDLGE